MFTVHEKARARRELNCYFLNNKANRPWFLHAVKRCAILAGRTLNHEDSWHRNLALDLTAHKPIGSLFPKP